jgi:hypothetical protein
MATPSTPSTQTLIKSYTIDMDIVLDCLRIIIAHEVHYRIEAVHQTQDNLILQVHYNRAIPHHRKVQEHIECILSDYSYYLYGSVQDNEKVVFPE